MKSNLDTDRPIRRILLECTDTYFTDWNTGIQRVVRNVAGESTAIGQQCGIECKPIVRIGDRFLALPWTPRISRPPSHWKEYLTRWWPAQDTWDSRLWLRLLRRCGIRLRKLLYPARWSASSRTCVGR